MTKNLGKLNTLISRGPLSATLCTLAAIKPTRGRQVSLYYLGGVTILWSRGRGGTILMDTRNKISIKRQNG